MSSLATAITHKVRVINDLSFDVGNRGMKIGANADTDHGAVPRWLCAKALPKFLKEIVRLRKSFPTTRVLMSKTNVSDAFRNVRVNPYSLAQKLCYLVRDLKVTDFRLTLGWSGSPGFWGILVAAAGSAHCNTTKESARLLGERKESDGTCKGGGGVGGEGKPLVRYPRKPKSDRILEEENPIPFLPQCI